MILNFSSAIRTGEANAIITEIGAGAKLRIYDGAKPAAGAAITTEVLLAEFTGNTPFGTAAAGVLTIDVTGMSVTAEAGIGTRTATWARITKADGTTWCLDMDVSDTGGNGVLKLDVTSISEGGTVTINSGSFTLGNQ